MTEKIGQAPGVLPTEDDLVTAIHRLLQASPQPLTLARIHSLLPTSFRSVSLSDLSDVLNRQVAAHVLCQYPKYRSTHDGFWDRSMAVHLADLLQGVLRRGPLPWSTLRRRLPIYARAQAETVLKEQVIQGRLFRHPRLGRAAERYGLEPCDAKAYLRRELERIFQRLEQLGFSQSQLRAGALELLHDEEWGLPGEPSSLARTPEKSSQEMQPELSPLDQPTIHSPH
jgi:hypothetical protein